MYKYYIKIKITNRQLYLCIANFLLDIILYNMQCLYKNLKEHFVI